MKTVSWAAQDMEPRLVLLSRGPELYSTRRLATEAEREGWMVDIIGPLAPVSYTHLTLPTICSV